MLPVVGLLCETLLCFYQLWHFVHLERRSPSRLLIPTWKPLHCLCLTPKKTASIRMRHGSHDKTLCDIIGCGARWTAGTSGVMEKTGNDFTQVTEFRKGSFLFCDGLRSERFSVTTVYSTLGGENQWKRSSLLTSWTAIKQKVFSQGSLCLSSQRLNALETKNGKRNLNRILNVYLNLSVPCWRVIVTLAQRSGHEHVCEHDTGTSSCSVKAIKVNGPAFFRKQWIHWCQCFVFHFVPCDAVEVKIVNCLWFRFKAESTTARRWTVSQRYTEVSMLNC